MSVEASFHSLPTETYFQVLGQLDSQSIEDVKTVCLLWRDIIQDPSFRFIKENKLNSEYSAKMQELADCICLLPPRLARIPDISDYGIWCRYAVDNNDEKALVEYNKKFNEFYQAFKERTIFQHHHIESKNCMSSAMMVRPELRLVVFSGNEKSKLPEDIISNQIECCYRSFYAKVIDDLIKARASHFKVIRSQNVFNKEIKFLKIYCPIYYIDNLINSLPQIIIEEASLEYADDVIKYKFKGTISLERSIYQQQLKATISGLEKELALLETKLIDLRGTNGFNGRIDAAFKEGDSNKYKELVSELQALAQFDNNGNIIGGNLFKLSQQIIKLKAESDAVAHDEYLSY